MTKKPNQFARLIREVILEDMAAKDFAHQQGFVYGGHAQWIDPKTRKVQGRTVDGKFVWSKNADKKEPENKGTLTIFNIDSDLIHGKVDKNSEEVKKYIKLVQAASMGTTDFIILTPRNGEKPAAQFLHGLGIKSGLKLKPIGSGEPDKIHDFLSRRIKEGYTHVRYLDSDPKNIHAAESLKATYNRLDIRLDTHTLPNLLREPNPQKKNDSPQKEPSQAPKNDS